MVGRSLVIVANLQPAVLRGVESNGMLLAAQPGTPVKRMVINDVGPLLPKDALKRIVSYVGNDPRFAAINNRIKAGRTPKWTF